MGAHVFRQVARLGEGLATGGADVGAAAGMGEHVSRQAVGARKGLTAGGAGVGAVAGMGAHVSRQFARALAGLATDRALDKVDLALRCTATPLARLSRASTPSFGRRILPPALASVHRPITLHRFVTWRETELVKTLKNNLLTHFILFYFANPPIPYLPASSYDDT